MLSGVIFNYENYSKKYGFNGYWLMCLFNVDASVGFEIRYDELDKASHMAMTNTQIVMQENIEDIYYKTNNARLKIDTNEDYLNLYKENFNILVNSDGEFNIDGYCDVYKGLMCVSVSHKYKNFLGQDKILTKKLINVIDVVNDNV